MPIHDIDVNDAGAAFARSFYLLAKTREIGGKNRWCQFDQNVQNLIFDSVFDSTFDSTCEEKWLPWILARKQRPYRAAADEETVFSAADRIAGISVHELPINTPVMKTSAPPNPTCKAADIHGVSM